jgi:cytochrome c-type biogenesis protein
MSFVFALLAGVFSTLSPCVLPLLPFILASATKEGRVWFALGLSLSFASIGLFIATVGFSLGFDGEFFKKIIALFMFCFGLLMLIENAVLSSWLSPFLSPFEKFFSNAKRGQFVTGLGLGVLWSPCVGPTLGAASLLAARGESLPQVFLTMFIFGLGTAVPLLALGYFSKEKLRLFAQGGKKTLGLLLIALGCIFFFGLDKQIETWLLNIYPEWLVKFLSHF